jgi:hypothetical protein
VKNSAGTFTNWTPTNAVFVSHDPTPDAPSIKVLAPLDQAVVLEKDPLTLRWVDSDPDSNATIKIFVNNQPLNLTLHEDPDGDSDELSIPPLPVGEHTIRVEISDGATTVSDQSCCELTVAPLPPDLDSDGDGVPDTTDNCRYTRNLSQQDSGSINSSTRDGIGDACQCGDLTGDGIVDSQDLRLYKSVLQETTPIGMPTPELCDLNGDHVCSAKDITTLTQLLTAAETGSAAPRGVNNCEAAIR